MIPRLTKESIIVQARKEANFSMNTSTGTPMWDLVGVVVWRGAKWNCLFEWMNGPPTWRYCDVLAAWFVCVVCFSSLFVLFHYFR